MNNHRSAHELPGLKHVLVDGFRHKMENISDPRERYYFLTHYHSDHYGGLNASWKGGNIICSRITRNLLVDIMGVQDSLITCVDMGSTVSIPLADVTFLDANHCPGAALLLFKIKKNAESRGVTEGSGRKLVPVSNSQTPGHVQSNNKNDGKEEDNRGGKGVEYSKIFLHTGDMRYHPRMQLYPALQNIRIDKIFLDTTYAHPKHKFITQAESISLIVSHSRAFLEEHPHGLILLGAYNIGKERVICELQDVLNLKVYMEEDKLKLMSCLGDEIAGRVKSGMFVSDPTQARIHVCRMGFPGTMHPYFKPNFDNLEMLRQEMNRCAESSAGGGAEDLYSHIKDCEPADTDEGQQDERDGKGIRGGEGEGCKGIDGLQRVEEENGGAEEAESEQVPHIISPSAPPLGRNPTTCPSTSSSFPDKVSHIMAFLPTGWAASSPFNERHSSFSKDGLTVRAVPYSEHSQCQELLEFVTFLKPVEILPTVFSDEKNRLFILDLFRNCVDRTANLRSFIDRMRPKVPAPSPSPVIMLDLEPHLESEGEEEVECLSGYNRNGDHVALSVVPHTSHSNAQSGVSGGQLVNNNNSSSSSSSKKRKSPITQGSSVDSAHAESKSSNRNNPTSSLTCAIRNVTSNAADTEVRRSEGNAAVRSKRDIGENNDKKELATAVKRSVSVEVDRAGPDVWTCTLCTYCHRAHERQYLQCAVCACNRPALSATTS